MRETKSINGVTFQVYHVEGNIEQMASDVIRRSKRLHDCYDRPSARKLIIYNEWMKWGRGVENLYTFDIDTYNTNIFTLSGVIENDDSIEVIHITPTKHILYTV